MKGYQWILSLVDKASGPMQSILARAEKIEGGMTKVKKVMAGVAVGALAFNQIGQAVQAANGEMQRFIAPGAQLQQSMADLKALTGANTEQLAQMEAAARRSAIVFGGDASASANAFKGILGELGPGIAKVPAALNSMGVSVSILSKTMEGDVVGAQQALTTGLQQFGGALETPQQKAAEMTRQMNIMAAAAGAGSAEVPHIAATMKVAGAAAAGAGIGFTEFNAATQVLANSTIKGAEAGTAFRNVITKLGEGRFLPKDTQLELKAAGVNIDKLGDKSLTFKQRLLELSKIQGDSALVAKFFGAENLSAGKALLGGTDLMAKFMKEITGTNAAAEMAANSMDTYENRMKRAGALWSDLGISAFKALEPMLPMITTTGQLAESGMRLAPIVSGLGSGLWKLAFGAEKGDKGLLGMAGSALKAGAKFLWAGITGVGSFILSLVSATAAQLGLNVVMSANPIGAIILGLLAVGGAVYMIIKHWDTVKVWLGGLAQAMLKLNPFYWLVKAAFAVFPGLEKWFKGLWDKFTGFFKDLVGGFKKVWDMIAPYLGFGSMNVTADGLQEGLLKSPDFTDPLMKGPGASPPNSKVKSKLDNVAAGGSKPTTVNITVHKLHDKIEVHTTNFTQGVNDAVAQIEEALLRIVEGVGQAVVD